MKENIIKSADAKDLLKHEHVKRLVDIANVYADITEDETSDLSSDLIEALKPFEEML